VVDPVFTLARNGKFQAGRAWITLEFGFQVF
jgi:hypothetical protein